LLANKPLVVIVVVVDGTYYGQIEDRVVQRTQGPVTRKKFFYGSGTSPAQGTVRISGNINFENVSFYTLIKI